MASLPPDVAASRRNRINNDIVELCNRPFHNPTNSYSLTGIGLYTHVSRIAIANNPTPLTQQPAQPRSKLEFLPLNGTKQDSSKATRQGELPDEIKSIYHDLTKSLDYEADLVSHEINHDPNVRFGSYEPPTPTLRLPDWICQADLLTLRSSILRVIELNDEERRQLQTRLDEKGWPPRLSSVEAYNASSEIPWSPSELNDLNIALA